MTADLHKSAIATLRWAARRRLYDTDLHPGHVRILLAEGLIEVDRTGLVLLTDDGITICEGGDK